MSVKSRQASTLFGLMASDIFTYVGEDGDIQRGWFTACIRFPDFTKKTTRRNYRSPFLNTQMIIIGEPVGDQGQQSATETARQLMTKSPSSDHAIVLKQWSPENFGE
ncbi:alcohol dehydrogenase [Aspergillus luchuensis]|uniref:Alcohol dehydrogenase n=1 Tax=Aspergillus kawachii TaxID=1069201 RepID=A0A146G2G2_ASPKA|nr:alcohol dehydrogenase [Aspergillus luchuensis]